MPEGQKRAWAAAAAVIAAPIAAFALLSRLPFTICHSKLLFGLPCPGCGLTRATDALLHLRFEESLAFHPLAVPVLLYLAVEMARGVLRVLRFERAQTLEALASDRVRAGLAISLVAVFVVRLAGGFGGLPDSVDPREGLVLRSMSWLVTSASSISSR